MTILMFVRHALHMLGGDRIAGRMPGVHLSPDGQRQAADLVERLRPIRIDSVFSSPLERTLETATPFARERDLDVEVRDELAEIDFGEWTGRAFAALREDPDWRAWNEFRSGRRTPGGEAMLEVQARIVGCMMQLCAERPGETLALVSHGDVIKAAIAYCLATPLDLFRRIEISPASVSVVVVEELGPWVLAVNDVGRLADLPTIS
jgi:probable phosphoglycerate mutase